jgi:histone H3/H4
MRKILNRNKVYAIKPKLNRFSPKAYTTLNAEIENIVRNTLNFSISIAEQNYRTTIRSEDIKQGLNEFLESYGAVYLKLLKDRMFNEINTFFEEKEQEVLENANRRLNYTKTIGKE